MGKTGEFLHKGNEANEEEEEHSHSMQPITTEKPTQKGKINFTAESVENAEKINRKAEI